jgi:hypothetical protein
LAHLKELGFNRITFATGRKLEDMPAALADYPVIGKEPPFGDS